MPRDLLAALGDGPVQLAGFTLSLEYRRCGKCQRCPHGPYLYARDRTRPPLTSMTIFSFQRRQNPPGSRSMHLTHLA